MQTSTPLSKNCDFRVNQLIPELSPDANHNSSLEDDNYLSSYDDDGTRNGAAKTGISDEMDITNITPPKSESSSVYNKGLANQTADWEKAALKNRIITRTTSLPELSINLSGNTLFNKYPSRVL